VIVQIYGFTTPVDVAEIRALAIDHVGVVLDEGFETWDQVAAGTAHAIVAEVPESMSTVALSLGTDYDRIARTVDIVRPDIVHLARATEMTPDAVHDVRERLTPIRIMTTVAVRDVSAVDTAQLYASCIDFLLLDSADPVTGKVGASGLTHDWSWSANIPPAVDVPVILAGGLGSGNVRQAIAVVKPSGVDSETRTSHAGERRRKDIEAVRRFVAAARSG
jgi:phosphoribosylanthranilate isomerase